MHPDLIEVNQSTVEGLGRLARFFNFSEVMGRLYGTLLMSPEALSLDDLASDLGISKGSVSMNMRALERWGMANEHWVRGERKKYYVAESDMWKVIRNVLTGRERREVQVALNVLSESVARLQKADNDLTPADRELAEFYLGRVNELTAFFQFAQVALESVLGADDALDFEMLSKFDAVEAS